MKIFLKRFFLGLQKRRSVIGALFVWCILLLWLTLGPAIAPHNPYDMQVESRLQPPNRIHWLGTDQYGRDALSRIIVGTRRTLGTSALAVSFAVLCGIVVGIIAASYPFIGNILMRVMDALFAFPSLLIAMFLASIMGPSMKSIMVAISVVYVPRVARLVYGITLEILTSGYIESAKAIAITKRRFFIQYIALNAISPCIVQATFYLADSILLITSLNFLGAGFRPTVPSWGNMISASRIYVVRAPWLLIFPGTAITLSIISTNILGDFLRDIIDPRMTDK